MRHYRPNKTIPPYYQMKTTVLRTAKYTVYTLATVYSLATRNFASRLLRGVNSDLLFLASLIVAALLGVPPCCVQSRLTGTPTSPWGPLPHASCRHRLRFSLLPARQLAGRQVASRKNSCAIISQILSCWTIITYQIKKSRL